MHQARELEKLSSAYQSQEFYAAQHPLQQTAFGVIAGPHGKQCCPRAITIGATKAYKTSVSQPYTRPLLLHRS